MKMMCRATGMPLWVFGLRGPKTPWLEIMRAPQIMPMS